MTCSRCGSPAAEVDGRAGVLVGGPARRVGTVDQMSPFSRDVYL
ncbi:hypothetical protein EVA_12372 [gut metagenome]|uniref:Uncharacterized protein n=1 Tax=gut metagenome TaxID=749906 RepID=J9GCK2_9ZZZZ